MRDIQNIENDEVKDGMALRDLLEVGLHYWYWFLVSVAFCLIGAYFVIKVQPKRYKSEATIMIKSDKNGGGTISETAIFADMGLGNNTNAIENEIFILRSTALIGKVVDSLGIDVSYKVKSLFPDIDVYQKSPVIVEFEKKELMVNNAIEIIINSDLSYEYRIKDVKNNTYLTDWNNGEFGKKIQTVRGNITIDKSPLYMATSNGTELVIKVNSKKKVIESILRNLTINRVDKITGILKLSITDESISKGNNILNYLIEAYNDDVINDKNKVATSTEKFIKERIADISGDLGGIDGKIERLKIDNNIPDFNSTSGMLVEKGSKYQEDVVKLNTEMSMIKLIRSYLSDASLQYDLVPTNTGISDIGMEAQIAKYNEEVLRLNKLKDNSGVNNPVTIELNKTLSTTKANMITSIDNTIKSLNIKLEQAKAQEDIAKRRIEAVPSQEKAVNTVIREQKIKEELFLYLLNKKEENALNLAIAESNAKIIESADSTEIPVAPIVMNYFIIAFILGFGIPAAVIYVLLLLDNKVHSKVEVEKYTRIPVLGQIPSKDKGKASGEFVISENGRDRISEAFRMVRNNLNFVITHDKVGGCVIQFTSTISGEGKTYSTINTALAFAHTNKRVVIVDLDIRKGTLSNHFDVSSKVGVSSFLSGKISNVDDIIHKSIKHANLDIITAGPIPPNPANLLMSEKLVELVDALRLKYDYVFFDTVPAMIVADAAIINRVADVTIYVIRNGVIDKRYLSELQKMYANTTFKNMNIIVTDIDIKKTYGGGNSYGYGYGYTNEDTSGYLEN